MVPTRRLGVRTLEGYEKYHTVQNTEAPPSVGSVGTKRAPVEVLERYSIPLEQRSDSPKRTVNSAVGRPRGLNGLERTDHGCLQRRLATTW